jgi:hopanoid biosynthesis associated protein HpnK
LKRLVVTADDFGAAREVNEAIEIAHTRGILTATSLMVAAPAAAKAVALAKRLPALRVGLHVVLVEGRPMLPPSQIPDLVGANGLFRTNMAASGAKMFFFPKVRRQLEHEIEAQFEAFRATGLALDHVNAHKHFHLHPTIASAILRIGKKHGMCALRVPREPGADRLVGAFAGLLMKRVRREGIVTPDRVFGLRWSGAMTKERVLGLVRGLPDGLSEIYLHPATGPYPGSAPGYRYADELAALTDGEVAEAARDPHIKLGGFTDSADLSNTSRHGL